MFVLFIVVYNESSVDSCGHYDKKGQIEGNK